MNVGERVVLVAPDWPCSNDSIVFEGQTGMVIGNKGFGKVVVSWDDLRGDEGLRTSDVDLGSLRRR